MFYFMGLAMVGTLIQMLIPEIVCEMMGEALGLMGIMIMIERDDYRLDYKTQANNRSALLHDLKNLIALKRHFYTICIRVENAELYRRLVGNDGYDFITAKGAQFLRSVVPQYDVYRTTAGNFFIVCPEATEEEINMILGKIKDRFSQGFSSGNGIAKVKAKILCARCPEELQDVEDILLLSDTVVEDTDKVVFMGKNLDFLLKKIEVQKAIVRGLNGNGFKVMYQPVYNKDTRRIAAAEALLTLKDNVLGDVHFRDFISVAEETGFVVELEDRMIESVFAFLKNGVIRGEMNLKLIVIHIMSVQVLKREMVEKVRWCLNEYGVDPSYVMFSVSDAIAIQAQDIMVEILDAFDDMGIQFSLANNDAGLLGLNPQVVSRFNGVSIDVRRHYDTTAPDQADIIMHNRVDMVKQLDKTVIIRGIESRKYYELVRELPVDYVAGDFLSESVTKNELQVKFWHRDAYWD